MPTIKCACINPQCRIELHFENYKLWFTDRQGWDTLMYLSDNTISKMIEELQAMLEQGLDKQ